VLSMTDSSVLSAWQATGQPTVCLGAYCLPDTLASFEAPGHAEFTARSRP